MAAGPWIVPDIPKLNLVNVAALASLTATNYRIALVGSGWTPNNATNDRWADMSANEIANGNGYTTGGIALSTVTLNQTTGTVKFTFTVAAPTWTASGAGIPAWRRMVLYYSGTVNSVVNPILAHSLGDGTGIDVPLTTATNTITVTAHANGAFTLT